LLPVALRRHHTRRPGIQGRLPLDALGGWLEVYRP
jgi:hypothetical protein